MAADIFVNYRREDTKGAAGRVADHLCSRFGRARVYFDVVSNELGVNYRGKLADELCHCQVFISIIGRCWLTVKNDLGLRRIDEPADLVRREIERALQRNILVIPVVVDDAVLPADDMLPDTVRPLMDRQAVNISHERFDADCVRLENRIADELKRSGIDPVPDDLSGILGKSYTLRSPCSSAELASAADIAGHFFPDENIDPSVIFAVHERSPNSFLVLKENFTHQVIAYADIFALRQSRIDGFKCGEIAEYDLNPDDFLALDSRLPADGFDLYLGGVAIMEDRNFERCKCATVLIYGLVSIALQTAFQAASSRRIYAVALSERGTKLLSNLGFRVLLRHENRRGDGDLYCRLVHRAELERQRNDLEIAQHLANIDIRVI